VPITPAFLNERLLALKGQYAHAGDFCFFTDTENLPGICASRRLLCRSHVLQQGVLRLDCASPDVLKKTPPWVHDYVRLYFAPRTPMLYQIEGIKRRPGKWPECPRPAYLVFDPIVLTLPSVRLSDGNMASKYSTCQDASDAFFASLRFEDIFHRGAISKDPEAEAMFGYDTYALNRVRRRQAEVLVPTELSLQYLRRVIFRSQAERDLSISDIGGVPNGVVVEVNEDWFFAPSLRRPYLDTFGQGTLVVANPLKDDALVRVVCSHSGVVSTSRSTFGETEWGPWNTIAPSESEVSAPPPPGGRCRYYLCGHRVAEVDAP